MDSAKDRDEIRGYLHDINHPDQETERDERHNIDDGSAGVGDESSPEESRIIIQVVTPSSYMALDYLQGDELLRWKDVILKRIDTSTILESDEPEILNTNISIWQLTDMVPANQKGRHLDNSLFLPQIDAFLIFCDVKEPGILREWLTEGARNPRLQELTPIIIGCHKAGESTTHFLRLFEGKRGIFMWRIGDVPSLYQIYRQIFQLLWD